MSKEQTLERRAVTALSDDTLTSATAAELIAELTRASAAARQDAAALAEQALDPAKKARTRQSPERGATTPRCASAASKHCWPSYSAGSRLCASWKLLPPTSRSATSYRKNPTCENKS